MADIPDLTQLTNQIFNNLLVKLKPYLEAGLILICAYIIYRLVKFFLAWKKARREKKTYENTEKILEIVERIEKKIDELITKPAKEKSREKGKAKKK